MGGDVWRDVWRFEVQFLKEDAPFKFPGFGLVLAGLVEVSMHHSPLNPLTQISATWF